MPQTNGTDLSPDEKYLYVSFSTAVSNNVTKYNVLPDGTVENPTTFIDFEGIDGTGRKRLDGMHAHGHCRQSVHYAEVVNILKHLLIRRSTGIEYLTPYRYGSAFQSGAWWSEWKDAHDNRTELQRMYSHCRSAKCWQSMDQLED
jgi:hypothetical protein